MTATSDLPLEFALLMRLVPSASQRSANLCPSKTVGLQFSPARDSVAQSRAAALALDRGRHQPQLDRSPRPRAFLDGDNGTKAFQKPGRAGRATAASGCARPRWIAHPPDRRRTPCGSPSNPVLPVPGSPTQRVRRGLGGRASGREGVGTGAVAGAALAAAGGSATGGAVGMTRTARCGGDRVRTAGSTRGGSARVASVRGMEAVTSPTLRSTFARRSARASRSAFSTRT